MELLFDNIQQYVSFSEEEKNLLSSFWSIKQLDRGERLLEEGSVCRYDAFRFHYFPGVASKKVRHLIIDLRQNGGGNNENVSTLFSFIASWREDET